VYSLFGRTRAAAAAAVVCQARLIIRAGRKPGWRFFGGGRQPGSARHPSVGCRARRSIMFRYACNTHTHTHTHCLVFSFSLGLSHTHRNHSALAHTHSHPLSVFTLFAAAVADGVIFFSFRPKSARSFARPPAPPRRDKPIKDRKILPPDRRHSPPPSTAADEICTRV